MSNGKISGVITSDSKVNIKTNLDGVKVCYDRITSRNNIVTSVNNIVAERYDVVIQTDYMVTWVYETICLKIQTNYLKCLILTRFYIIIQKNNIFTLNIGKVFINIFVFRGIPFLSLKIPG